MLRCSLLLKLLLFAMIFLFESIKEHSRCPIFFRGLHIETNMSKRILWSVFKCTFYTVLFGWLGRRENPTTSLNNYMTTNKAAQYKSNFAKMLSLETFSLSVQSNYLIRSVQIKPFYQSLLLSVFSTAQQQRREHVS